MVHINQINTTHIDPTNNQTYTTSTSTSSTDFAPGQLCGYADGALGCSMCTDADFYHNRIEGCASQWLNGGAFECPLAKSRQPGHALRQLREPRARARAAPEYAARR